MASSDLSRQACLLQLLAALDNRLELVLVADKEGARAVGALCGHTF